MAFFIFLVCLVLFELDGSQSKRGVLDLETNIKIRSRIIFAAHAFVAYCIFIEFLFPSSTCSLSREHIKG